MGSEYQQDSKGEKWGGLKGRKRRSLTSENKGRKGRNGRTSKATPCWFDLEGVFAGFGFREVRFLRRALGAEPRLPFARIDFNTRVIRTALKKIILAVSFFGDIAFDGAGRAWRG